MLDEPERGPGEAAEEENVRTMVEQLNTWCPPPRAECTERA